MREVGDGRVYLATHGLGGVAGPVQDDVFLPSVDPVPLNAWTRVTASWDSNTNEARLWINSELVNSWTDAFGPLSNVVGGAVRIGAQFNDDPDCRFHGIIDEVRLFEGAISPGGAAADSNVFAIGVCGDGSIVGMEECDDGNVNDADGCSSTCVIEPGSVCEGAPSVCVTSIPAASTWGLVVMAFLLASVGAHLALRRKLIAL